MDGDTDKYAVRNVTSKIPTPVSPLGRSHSFRVRGEKANLSSSLPVPPIIEENGVFNDSGLWKRNFMPLNLSKGRIYGSKKNGFDDDLESIGSVASNFSTTTNNSSCEHAHFAKNGTTYSGKSHKYIVHCSTSSTDPEEYLTPTQRANRSIKRLKSLLQLAKEKLREKEQEIFKLSKEVAELKLYKETVETSSNTDKSPGDINSASPKNSVDGPSQENCHYNSSCGELSPIKNYSEENHSLTKMSPVPSHDYFGEKNSATPDYLLSSMADSGNFDDLPSSASIHSKDSMSFIATPELRHMPDEQLFVLNESLDEDKVRIIKAYEKKLGEKKFEYEMELSRILKEQEEKNVGMMQEFERKLKEEELKFESRWNNLLKTTEEEKMMIVSRFEEKLDEEREKYKESLKHFQMRDGLVPGKAFEKSYLEKVDEEKTVYETCLKEIKQKFEEEKTVIEEKFDKAVRDERNKFEESLKQIKEISQTQVAELTKKVAELQTEYSELLPKYENAMSRTERLEKENTTLKETIRQQEECHKKIYLDLFKKGQEAAKLEMDDQESESSEKPAKKVSNLELFAQLKITEVELENLKAMYKRLAEVQANAAVKQKTGNSDPEATLQFLKSAVYYFLTDRENHLGHLKAIESILAFTPAEKSNIEKAYLYKY